MRGMSVDSQARHAHARGSIPGLTAVALFALSLAIGAGAAYLEFVNDLLHGKLPFPDADRIVGIQVWDQESGDPDPKQTANFVAWRDSLRSIEELAAYRALDRNLITEDGRAEPVRGVEISAAAFRIAQVPPLLGRPLQPEDERVGAAPVVVIGYDVWTARLGSDPGVIGKSVRLGKASYTIVGVMPASFGLPSQPQLVGPAAIERGVLSAPPGAADADVRQARARHDDQHGAGGIDGARRSRGRGFPRHRSTSETGGPAVRRIAVVGGRRLAHADARALQRQRVLHRPARALRRQHRDAGVRAHRDARRRDQRADGARREPRPHCRPVVRGSARAVVAGGDRRIDDRRRTR